MAVVYTPVEDIPAIVAGCRQKYESGALRPLKARRAHLETFIKLLDENRDAFVEAASLDLRKCANETILTEVQFARNEAVTMLNNLSTWTAAERVIGHGVAIVEGLYIQPEPLGVVLVIGAWNYPFQLTLVGAIGAIAAGNAVVIKPSEVAPNCAKLMKTLLSVHFPQEVVAVVNGAVPEATALLAERFDHILYTGNSTVAKIVMAAAAKHLTPVTLELGGKSPCIVDESCDLAVTAKRVMWGRTVNAGQTCVAPDYILVHRSVKDSLIAHLREARTQQLGADPATSSDYCRIINDFHFKRVERLLSGGTVVVGGERDAATRYFAPTVLDNVDINSPLMTEEIFGPLLPLVPYDTLDEAIGFINRREKPLALYVFSKRSTVANEVIGRTSSGAVVVNDVLMHTAVDVLPFGGVGHSGMGAYHGKFTFDTFSHRKAIMKRSAGLEFLNEIRYPPYSDKKLSILEFLLKTRRQGYVGSFVSAVVRATAYLIIPIGAITVASRM